MFYGQRVVDIPGTLAREAHSREDVGQHADTPSDGLPKWTGINETSDLIEDSPPDVVRELERKRAKEQSEKVEKGENS